MPQRPSLDVPSQKLDARSEHDVNGRLVPKDVAKCTQLLERSGQVGIPESQEQRAVFRGLVHGLHESSPDRLGLPAVLLQPQDLDSLGRAFANPIQDLEGTVAASVVDEKQMNGRISENESNELVRLEASRLVVTRNDESHEGHIEMPGALWKSVKRSIML